MKFFHKYEKANDFYRSKAEEYKTYTLVLLIAISTACVLLNGWDRVVDPIHGAAALSLRLLMLPAFVFYLIPYKLKMGYRALSLYSFLSVVYLVTVFVAIVSTFDNGIAHSFEGFVVAFICFLAITNSSPFKYVLLYSAVLFVYPVVLDALFFHDVVNVLLYFSTMPVIVILCLIIAYTAERSAYEKYLLSEKLKEQSSVDSLTRCYNRRKFDEMFDGALGNRTEGDKLSMVLIDIDNFKWVNDTFGHKIGDDVLKNIANSIKSVVRAGDIVIRWGGEEFLVVFPHTGVDACQKLAERIVEKCDLPLNPTDRVTVSAGFGELCEEDIESLIARADQALYEAKKNGKRQARRATNKMDPEKTRQ